MQKYRYRCAITGRYVTQEYAEKNPDTTVRETIKGPLPTPEKSK